LFRTEHKPPQNRHKYSINTNADTEQVRNKKRRTLGARRFWTAAQQGYTTLQTRYNSFALFTSGMLSSHRGVALKAANKRIGASYGIEHMQ
jgi:hypothetical protein